MNLKSLLLSSGLPLGVCYSRYYNSFIVKEFHLSVNVVKRMDRSETVMTVEIRELGAGEAVLRFSIADMM